MKWSQARNMFWFGNVGFPNKKTIITNEERRAKRVHWSVHESYNSKLVCQCKGIKKDSTKTIDVKVNVRGGNLDK
jgi:hypothetical protein